MSTPRSGPWPRRRRKGEALTEAKASGNAGLVVRIAVLLVGAICLFGWVQSAVDSWRLIAGMAFGAWLGGGFVAIIHYVRDRLG